MTPPARDEALDTYLRRVRAAVGVGPDADAFVRGLASVLLDDTGVDVPARFADGPGLDASLVPPVALRTPWLLGHVRESLLDAGERRRAGAHYTPPAIAQGLVALSLVGLDAAARPIVCDPAAGGGAFLLAAAEALAARGIDRDDVVRVHCHGADIDPLSVDVTRATLALWAGAWWPELDANVVVADALGPSPWPCSFDLVVGNPPFQGQLDGRTARTPERTAELRARLGDAVVGYVDTAALFLVRALELVAPGGRVALIQPHSTLAARDAAGVRAAVDARARMVALWFTDELVFRAGVRVWAPVVERGDGAGPGSVQRRVGPTFDVAPAAEVVAAGEWTPLVADLAGIPMPRLRTSRVVGDLATATAGFRDQYYGLVGAVHEGTPDDERPRLLTTGAIDVLDTTWHRSDVRFASRTWRCPVVDVDALSPRTATWVRAQLVPKLVVATQTKVVEVAVDEHGAAVPSTPVIAVHARAEQLWLLAAALGAPPIAAVARLRTYGSALSAGALKLSARQVLALPLPADRAAWEEAARCARKVPGSTGAARHDALEAFAAAGCAAYGVTGAAGDDLAAWWLALVNG